MKIILIPAVVLILAACVPAQTNLTLENAIEIAMTNSPDIRQSRINLDRSREFLNAENARLKSQFSLNLIPFEYNKDRSFDDFNSAWYTSELKQSSGIFTIRQFHFLKCMVGLLYRLRI